VPQSVQPSQPQPQPQPQSQPQPHSQPQSQPQPQPQPQAKRQSSGSQGSVNSEELQDAMRSELGRKVGSLKGKPYVLLEQIGKGGTSTVSRVLDHKFRMRAIKIIDLTNADRKTEESVGNEIQVMRMLARANCELVVKLIDFDVKKEGKNRFLEVMMELGEISFHDYMQKNFPNKPLPVNHVRLYWEMMLEAVHSIHELSVVHSDLKPHNFVFVQGRLKLIDFGIANQIGAGTTNISRDSQIGTINFISPEALNAVDDASGNAQARYKLGRASDIWSLGVILHLMLFGEHLFAMGNIAQKLQAICSQVEIDFSKKQCDVPHAVDVLRGCLKRQPKERLTIPELLAHDFLH
jgi:serine/threonine-protein kinase TTK/MPS1